MLFTKVSCSLIILLIGLFANSESIDSASAQERDRDRIRDQTLNRFDTDGNGRLSVEERKRAQAFLRERFSDSNAREPKEIEPSVDPKTTPLYKLADGPFDVDSRDFELPRTAPEPALPVKITFPVAGQGSWKKNAEKLPVIIFSHDAGASREAYQPLNRYWATHGYIVLQPTHRDSLSLLSLRDRQKIRLKDYITNGGIEKWLIPRTEDITLVLDKLEKIQAAIPDLKFEMDSTRIGLGGHSYGAFTTQLIGGLSLKSPTDDAHSEFADPRPIALLMISPQGLTDRVVESSFDQLKRPAMVVTGSRDDGVRGEPANWRLAAFEKMPTARKYLTFIEGAGHHFGGISGVNYLASAESNTDHVYYVRSATLAWWDAELKSDPSAIDFLDSEKMQQVTDWVARISTSVKVEK